MTVHQSLTLTESLAIQTKKHLNDAHQKQDFYANHLVGRLKLLGTAVVGTVEVIVRLALFSLGHIAGAFCLYQSDDINQFLQEQTQAGFSASIISSAGLFSLLAPTLFREITFPQESAIASTNPQEPVLQEPIHAEEVNVHTLQNRVIQIRRAAIEERLTSLILDIVGLPFKMVATFYKLPFYFVYLSLQLAVILPIRLMLLPLQLFINALSIRRPQTHLDLNLI